MPTRIATAQLPTGSGTLDAAINQLPTSVRQALINASLGGVGGVLAPGESEPTIAALGKPVSELFGRVFRTRTPGGETGISRLMRLTNWNASTGKVQLHGLAKAGERIEATPEELSALIDAGHLDLDQPPTSAIGPIQKRLEKALGQSRTRTPDVRRAAESTASASEGPTVGPTRVPLATSRRTPTPDELSGVDALDAILTATGRHAPNPLGHGTRKK